MPGTFSRPRLQRKPLVSDPGMHHCTCVTQIRGGEENVPGIPGACATCNFMYLVRGPWQPPDVNIDDKVDDMTILFFSTNSIDGLVPDWRNPIANALEIPQSCNKPPISHWQPNTSGENVHVFCMVLSQLGDKAVDVLLKALEDTEQKYIAKELRRILEEEWVGP